MSKQVFRVVALLILATALMAACAALPSPLSPSTPTASCPSSGAITTSLVTPQPADILLGLAWEGGLTRPELAFAYGRVPEFSLLPDGQVYYLDPAEWDRAQVMTASLTPAETQALRQRVLDLGFERLESYTDLCQPQGDGTCLCVADAAESVLRVRLPGGELRVVRNYHTFANDPEALTAIRSLLQDYQHPAATPYTPEEAALFVRSAAPPSNLPILDWPLPPAWLAGGTPDAACVRTLAGTDLQALLAVTRRNIGDFYFRTGDQIYNIYMGSSEGVGEKDEHPQHIVTLNAFWIDETEVTRAHYQTCIEAGVCSAPGTGDDALSGKPVTVTWAAAQTYCRWVGGRLPTQAEWENAARGSDAATYPWGGGAARSCPSWGEVDAQANHCRRAVLDLESGEILSCEDWACAIP